MLSIPSASPLITTIWDLAILLENFAHCFIPYSEQSLLPTIAMPFLLSKFSLPNTYNFLGGFIIFLKLSGYLSSSYKISFISISYHLL